MKINISQKDANQLLHLASELIITCKSWGYDLDTNPVLKYRDADTGEVLPGWSGDKLTNMILKIREKGKNDQR